MQGMNKKTGGVLSGIEHVHQSIIDILTTPIGSRPMRRDYGSRLFERVDAPMNGELIAEIYSDVVESLFNYEPRVEVTSVSVESADAGTIVINLVFNYLPTGETSTITGITI